MSPKSQERMFPRSYSTELLRIARGDHDSASFLLSGLGTEGVRPENVAYLFQQAIEKALKAALCALGHPVPLVHDLGVLIAKIPDSMDPDFGYELSGLDEYATIRRYEEGRLVLSSEELEDIAAISAGVLRWGADVLESNGIASL
ncbi:MAG: HEPN domain-containing protein [Spirochaetota bacterium]